MTFTQRVEGCERDDGEGGETDVSGARAQDVEAESSSQAGPSHLGESEWWEGSPSVGIDDSDGRSGESGITHRFRWNARRFLGHT